MDFIRNSSSTELNVQAGAKLHATLEPAHVVIGIKEAPLNELITIPVPARVVRVSHPTHSSHVLSHHQRPAIQLVPFVPFFECRTLVSLIDRR